MWEKLFCINCCISAISIIMKSMKPTSPGHNTGSYGPVPQKLDSILFQMITNGDLQRIKTEYHGYPQTRYLPLKKADLTQMNAAEKETIDQVIEQFSDWSAAAISKYPHRGPCPGKLRKRAKFWITNWLFTAKRHFL